jgi:hypothetical protein
MNICGVGCVDIQDGIQDTEGYKGYTLLMFS